VAAARVGVSESTSVRVRMSSMGRIRFSGVRRWRRPRSFPASGCFKAFSYFYPIRRVWKPHWFTPEYVAVTRPFDVVVPLGHGVSVGQTARAVSPLPNHCRAA
jgi:hypothetical protein